MHFIFHILPHCFAVLTALVLNICDVLFRYHDGMIATNRDQPQIMMKRLFYPKWWLQATGYFNQHGNFGPGVILFAPNPNPDTDTAEGGANADVGDSIASGTVRFCKSVCAFCSCISSKLCSTLHLLFIMS